MNLKKFALRGILILTVVLVLCAFFSGTVRTITTAKVRLTSGKMGKLEEKTPITASVTFPQTEEIALALEDGVTLTITRVNTRPGYTMTEGDVLLEAQVTGFSEAMDQLRTSYDTAAESLASLERKNAGIRIRSQDTEYVSALTGLRSARSDEMAARIAMDTLLNKEGLLLPDEGPLPEEASVACQEAVDAWRKAAERLAQAEAAYARVERYAISDDVLTYLTEKSELEAKMAEAEEDMRSLSALNAEVAQITAPHDGYVAELKVAQGDTYDGKSALALVSAKGTSPVLRADLSGVERQVSKGATATMEARWSIVETRVTNVGTDSEGKQYADLDINRDILDSVGTVYSLMQGEQKLTLVYKALEATCLVPVSAVHGTGDDRYVFVVNRQSTTLGADTMTVTKMSVKVNAEVDGVASLENDISWYTIAYMEDRTIEDGDAVMEYSK